MERAHGVSVIVKLRCYLLATKISGKKRRKKCEKLRV